MNDLNASGHTEWFREVRRILDIIEVTPGFPKPFISPDRTAFYFTAITHAADAREAVEEAQTILSYALNVTFARREAIAGDDTLRYILEAFMPSGLAVDIVARAEHMSTPFVPVPGSDTLAAVA